MGQQEPRAGNVEFPTLPPGTTSYVTRSAEVEKQCLREHCASESIIIWCNLIYLGELNRTSLSPRLQGRN
jgi:hypothetical protein